MGFCQQQARLSNFDTSVVVTENVYLVSQAQGFLNVMLIKFAFINNTYQLSPFCRNEEEMYRMLITNYEEREKVDKTFLVKGIILFSDVL